MIVLESRGIALELGVQQEIYRQLKAQLELMNVTLASEAPVFQVLEMAEAPETKSGPGRGLICIIVTFAAVNAGMIFLDLTENTILKNMTVCGMFIISLSC